MSPALSQSVATVQEIERQGEWVAARSSPFGFQEQKLRYWRKHGCPYLPRRKLRAKRMRVRVEGWREAELWFFHRETLARISSVISNGRPPQPRKSKEYKARWAESDRFEDADGIWVRLRPAARSVGCARKTLREWSKKGCPYLGDRRLQTRTWEVWSGKTAECYLQSELEEIKRRRAALLPSPDDEDMVTVEEAARMTRLRAMTIYQERDALGLAWRKVRARRKKDGKPCWKVVLARGDVEDLARRRTALVPQDRITVQDAAELLGVSVDSVRDWCKEECPYLGRPIGWTSGPVQTGSGLRPVWLLLRADVEKVQDRLRLGPPPYHDEEGIWLPANLAEKLYGATMSALRNRYNRGLLVAKQITAHDRWNHGKRWVYLETSLQELFGAKPRGAAPQVSAESRTTRNTEKHAPLPQQPYPVDVSRFSGQAGEQIERLYQAIAENTQAHRENGQSLRNIEALLAKKEGGDLISLIEAERLSGVNRGVIWRAIQDGKIDTNGKKGRNLRISSSGFARWLLDRVSKPEPVESDAAVKKKLQEATAG